MSQLSSKHINESMNDYVAQPVNIPLATTVNGVLALNATMFYTEADTFAGNPDGLLGSVMQTRIVMNDNQEKKLVLEFCPTKIPNTIVDPNSLLKEPIKRQSIIVDQKITAEVNFLNYLSSQIDSDSSFSLLVFDQATGQVDRNPSSWSEGIKTWKEENQDLITNPDITNIFVIIGYVQKYVIRKKYQKFDAKVKGGGYGINIGGELYTSAEDYSLDIRYGLNTASLKNIDGAKKLGVAPQKLVSTTSAQQLQLLNTFEKIQNELIV